MVELKNEYIKVKISEIGAELKSIKNSNDREFLWSGDEKIWHGQSPLLFPICGGLKDGKYIFKDKEYTLNKHGYAKTSVFEVERQSETIVTFLLTSNDKTLITFPFHYELRVIYTLKGNSLEVTYNIKNNSNSKMYFSIGAHEGYACPEGIEKYSIVFEKEENAYSYILNGELLEHNKIQMLNGESELQLKYEYFEADALVFKDLKSRSVILKHNENGNIVKVDFEGFDYFLLWTKPNASYICIEPWCGIQDSIDSNYDITKKEGIQILSPNAEFERTHIITI